MEFECVKLCVWERVVVWWCGCGVVPDDKNKRMWVWGVWGHKRVVIFLNVTLYNRNNVRREFGYDL